MDEKNKLVYKGIKESSLRFSLKLRRLIESNTLNYFYFSGEIGSGKTSYIRILLKHIGINENIKSPSFNMVEHYETERKTIYHVDLFRMGKSYCVARWRNWFIVRGRKYLIFWNGQKKQKGCQLPMLG